MLSDGQPQTAAFTVLVNLSGPNVTRKRERGTALFTRNSGYDFKLGTYNESCGKLKLLESIIRSQFLRIHVISFFFPTELIVITLGNMDEESFNCPPWS